MLFGGAVFRNDWKDREKPTATVKVFSWEDEVGSWDLHPYYGGTNEMPYLNQEERRAKLEEKLG